VYSALGAGLLSGTKNSVQDIVGMKLHEHIKHLLVDRHGYMAAMWWYSDEQWRALPPDVRAVVEQGFDALRDATRAAAVEREAPALEAFRRLGGRVEAVSPAQRAEFKEATATLREWYAARYGTTWINELDAAVASCEARHPGAGG
jgi:TRAP-type C4-dicarboxylate transport system substrate-binding protein